MPPPKPALTARAAVTLTRTNVTDLKGWANHDPANAMTAFRRSCGVLVHMAPGTPLGGAGYAGTVADWREACEQAAALSSSDPAALRAFFSAAFVPYRVSQETPDGLFTGYFEPELKGSRTRHDAYQTPLYAVPPDLVTADLGLFRDMLRGQRLAGRVMNGRLVPYPARADIVRNGLPGQPLFYVDDPVDAFFLQIQGSGRIVLDDGSVVRAAYGAQNGRPYTAIGAILVQRGELKREDVSAQSIRAWLAAHPAEAPALMDQNASYVFFSEAAVGDPALGPPGSEGVPLTPAASLAVDLSVHALGVPVWLETSAPDADPSKPDRSFDALLVAQDTGGAIRGAVRGDVFWGFGPVPGSIAGRMRSQGRLSVLLPRTVAARLGARADLPLP
jgi:membrane-bound lytic murein transglycosylase A